MGAGNQRRDRERRRAAGGAVTEFQGWMTLADGSHVPLPSEQAQKIYDAAMAARSKRAADMPDVETALRVMTEAYHRLEELGFRNAVYCPKDGSAFEVIEAGSSGIHRCSYHGDWPTGSWWVEDNGDLWPSRPILYRLYPEDEAKRKAKMEAASVAYEMDRES